MQISYTLGSRHDWWTHQTTNNTAPRIQAANTHTLLFAAPPSHASKSQLSGLQLCTASNSLGFHRDHRNGSTQTKIIKFPQLSTSASVS